MKLICDIMHDGSRNFILLPVGSVSSIRLLLRVFSLRGAFPTGYIPSLSESWIDFRFSCHSFSINNQFGDYWFFVKDPDCPEIILNQVVDHFSGVLDGKP
jgi:hypothetical protein